MPDVFAETLLTAQQVAMLRVRVMGGLTLRVSPDAIATNRTRMAAIANLYGQLGSYLAAGQPFDDLPGQPSRAKRMMANREIMVFLTDVLWIFVHHMDGLIARLNGPSQQFSETAGSNCIVPGQKILPGQRYPIKR